MILLAFRLNISRIIGYGHFMRCLNIANEMKKRNKRCIFVINSIPNAICDLLLKYGHEYISLEENVYQEFDYLNDAKSTIDAIKDKDIEWLIVDNYDIDSRWHKLLRVHVKKILVIDDLANRYYDCDLLIDQSYKREEKEYQNYVKKECKLLTGTNYTLLDERYSYLRIKALNRRRNISNIENIFISVGSIDNYNIINKTINAIKDVSWDIKPVISISVSSETPNLNDIKALINKSEFDINLNLDDKNVPERIMQADLSIGACGTTTWERCSLGLPSIVIVLSENQKHISRVLSEDNVVIDLGEHKNVDEKLIKQKILLLKSDKKLMNNLSNNGFNLVDGLGVKRLCQYIYPSKNKYNDEIILRPLNTTDLDTIYDWQSNSKIREYFNNTDTPTKEEHSKWFENRLISKNKITSVITVNDSPAGVICLDPIESEGIYLDIYAISIYLIFNYQGRGIAFISLKIIESYFNNVELQAQIKKDNESSLSLFKKLGYTHRSAETYCKKI